MSFFNQLVIQHVLGPGVALLAPLVLCHAAQRLRAAQWNGYPEATGGGGEVVFDNCC